MSYRTLLFSFVFFSSAIFYNSINAMYLPSQSIEKNLSTLDQTISKLIMRTGQTRAAQGNCVELERTLKQHVSKRDNFQKRYDHSKQLNSLALLKEVNFDIQAYLLEYNR